MFVFHHRVGLLYRLYKWQSTVFLRLDSPHMQSSDNAPFPSISGVTPRGPAATVVDTSGTAVSLNFSVA